VIRIHRRKAIDVTGGPDDVRGGNDDGRLLVPGHAPVGRHPVEAEVAANDAVVRRQHLHAVDGADVGFVHEHPRLAAVDGLGDESLPGIDVTSCPHVIGIEGGHRRHPGVLLAGWQWRQGLHLPPPGLAERRHCASKAADDERAEQPKRGNPGPEACHLHPLPGGGPDSPPACAAS
jgi:hypothetical protein